MVYYYYEITKILDSISIIDNVNNINYAFPINGVTLEKRGEKQVRLNVIGENIILDLNICDVINPLSVDSNDLITNLLPILFDLGGGGSSSSTFADILANGNSTGNITIVSPDNNSLAQINDGYITFASGSCEIYLDPTEISTYNSIGLFGITDTNNTQSRVIQIKTTENLLKHNIQNIFDSPINNFPHEIPNKIARFDVNGNLTSSSIDVNDLQLSLISGTNIKTVNGNNLLGSGDLQVGTILGTVSSTLGNIPFSSGVSNTVTTGNLNYNSSTQTLSGMNKIIINNSVYSNTQLLFGTAVNSPYMFCSSPGYQLSTAFTGQLLYYNQAIQLQASLSDAGLWTCKTLNVGSGTPLINQTTNIVGSLAGTSNSVGMSATNTNTTGAAGINIGESLANRLALVRFGSTSTPGVINGTSINLQDSSYIFSNSTSGIGTGTLYFTGLPVIHTTGITATNIGTRLDATGLRIGVINTLHTANTTLFQIGSSLTYNGTNMQIGTGTPLAVVDINTVGSINGTGGFSATNTGTGINSASAFLAGQSIGKRATFAYYNTSNTSIIPGTSIPFAERSVFSATTSGTTGDGNLVLLGTPIISIIGSTTTNIGTRLDATGLRIGAINTLHTANSAVLDIADSNTTRASLRIRTGVAPTTPNDGDIWFDGTDIKMRVGGVTKTFTLV